MPEPLKLANGQQIDIYGYAAPLFTDWNGDGRMDLVCNSKSVMLYENVGMRDGKWFFRDCGNLSDEPLAGHTTSPSPCDFDRDGVPDLLVGAEDGFFYLLRNPGKVPQ